MAKQLALVIKYIDVATATIEQSEKPTKRIFFNFAALVE